MSPLRLNGSTSGNVTLDCPAVGGNNTLVLPTGNGSAQQVLAGNGSGALSWSNRPILQVVSATSSTEVATTSTSRVTSGLSASITPASSSNKVLIMIATPVGRGTGNSNNGLNASIYKNGAALQNWDLPFIWTNTDINLRHMLNFSYVDSPATTSSTTYALFFSSNVSGQTVNVQQSNQMGTIILMEVAA